MSSAYLNCIGQVFILLCGLLAMAAKEAHPLDCRIRPYTLVKLCVTILIGITVGVLAMGLALGTEKIIIFKNEVARSIIHDGRPLGVFRAALFHIAFSIALVTIGSSMVRPEHCPSHLYE